MTLFGKKIRQRPFRPSTLMVLVVITLSIGLSGCVQRRLTIRSNPPGALVYVDDYPIGNTPVSTNFTYYGTRKIRLVKDGYETLTVKQDIRTPWYEYVPIDFITENLVPGKISDRRVLDYQLRPQMVVPTDQLQARAEDLRRSTHGSAAVPLVQPATVIQQPQPSVPSGNYPSASPPFSASPSGTPEMIPAPGIGGQPVRPVQP
jgi:hypothetical protein